jgi:hypothetical protein
MDKDNNWCVYKHTSPSGKVYIGITGCEVRKRWKGGYGYCAQPYFYNAILKYGWDNISHEILETELSKQEAGEREKYYIKLYNSDNALYGYNISSGGNSCYKHKGKPIAEISRLGKTILHIYNSANEMRTLFGYPVYKIRSLCEENRNYDTITNYKDCIKYPFYNSKYFTKKADCRIYKYLEDINIDNYNLSSTAKEYLKSHKYKQ